MENMIDLFPPVEGLTCGQKIKIYRQAYNLSQMDLSRLTEISQNNLSAIENDKRQIGIDTAVRFCAVFPVNLEDLLFPGGIDTDPSFLRVKKNLNSMKKKGA